MARKILLADDSVTAQNMGRKILADAGYDVVTVNNGSAALKRIAEIKPDLIVLDVYMPGYSGLEVCQRLKDAPESAHIPVLLTVGKLEPFKPDEARRVKADAHIVKPFEASELLTAITRLEDHMVPLQADGTRGDGGENNSTETGWKSRLRFPSKKKKEEPEPEDPAIAGGTFRDFRKGKSKGFAGKAAAQEPEVVPDIPRDITPEELDVLSALAARLDGPNPAAEHTTPLPDTTTTKTVADEVPEVEVAATQAVASEAAADQIAPPGSATEAQAGTEEKTEVETPTPAGEAATFAAEGQSEVVIPAEHVELAAENTVVVSDTVAADANRPEGKQSENQNPETPAAVIAVGVDTGLLAEAPAPVDRDDEPEFAAAAKTVELATVEPAKVESAAQNDKDKAEDGPVEAVSQSQMSPTAEVSAPADVIAAQNLESQPEASQPEALKTQDSNSGALQVENSAQVLPMVANERDAVTAEEPAPSDEELAQALSLLTPASSHAGVLETRAQESRVVSGPRWIAEPAVLSREESEISLEAEMFRTFAATAATTAGTTPGTASGTTPGTASGTTPAIMLAAASGGHSGSGTITGVSAIAAAVENRLAEAELVARAKTLPAYESRHTSDEPSSSEPGLPTAVETPAEAMAAKVSEGAPAAEATAATLADADGQHMVGHESIGQGSVQANVAQTSIVQSSVEATADAPAAAPAQENQDSSSGVEEQESMGKDVKSKSGKSNWRQIRTAPAGAPGSDAAETQDAPKAMAAAAAAEGASSSSAPDASTIASIVDSVMADLRPKIVEEIARKLAGK